MRKIIVTVLSILCLSQIAHAQKARWSGLLQATQNYMHHHMWNPETQNYVLRADEPTAPGSDSWGITIVLDAQAYMVASHLLKPEEMKNYFVSSTMIYDRTNGTSGARILGRMQNGEIYMGGDDDLQWDAALAHCFEVTHDSDYLNAAQSSFKGLIDNGFWMDGVSKGWMWNSRVRQPDGVSTAYGALTAARLYTITHDNVYKQWAAASLNALRTPQVGIFPRDEMVAADAALTTYLASHDEAFHKRAMELLDSAIAGGLLMLHHQEPGHRNPTDIGDLADGLMHFYDVTHNPKYKTLAETFINFFVDHRTTTDIATNGFYNEYDMKGQPVQTGTYLGIPNTVPYLSEVAEMLKLFAIAASQS